MLFPELLAIILPEYKVLLEVLPCLSVFMLVCLSVPCAGLGLCSLLSSASFLWVTIEFNRVTDEILFQIVQVGFNQLINRSV